METADRFSKGWYYIIAHGLYTTAKPLLSILLLAFGMDKLCCRIINLAHAGARF